MFDGIRQQSGARSIGRLPIAAAIAEQIVGRGNDYRPYDQEQENNDVLHGRAAVRFNLMQSVC
jgi:hypothetical protein